MDELDTFTRQYIGTMLWAENNPDTGEPLDKDHGLSDLAPETLQRCIDDCKAFQAKAGDLIEGREEDAGHDFWLTRNGHGCGFWETPDWPEADGKVLTKLAKEFGELNPFVNDDGKVYFI